MKLLYFSCHAILEYDELKLFEEMGIDYFSLGSYVNPRKPVDPIRPALNHIPAAELMEHAPDRSNVPIEFIKQFDYLVIMHMPEWVEANWEKCQQAGVKMIWRTIGQSDARTEQRLWKYRTEGLKVVRYSKMEVNIPQNIGCDKIIPFYKDPAEYGPWNGAGNEVITVAQNMEARAQFCNFDAFKEIVQGFNGKLYGKSNEQTVDLNGGYLTYDEMKQKMRDARVYVYTGTQPASYTLNFIEAMITGVPMVCLGPQHATSLNIAGNVYEIPEIIQNGVNGFWSDDIAELRKYVTALLADKKLATRIGALGRETAIKLFGKETVKAKWKEFLGV